jgi:hypothetical protein
MGGDKKEHTQRKRPSIGRFPAFDSIAIWRIGWKSAVSGWFSGKTEEKLTLRYLS